MNTLEPTQKYRHSRADADHLARAFDDDPEILEACHEYGILIDHATPVNELDDHREAINAMIVERYGQSRLNPPRPTDKRVDVKNAIDHTRAALDFAVQAAQMVHENAPVADFMQDHEAATDNLRYSDEIASDQIRGMVNAPVLAELEKLLRSGADAGKIAKTLRRLRAEFRVFIGEIEMEEEAFDVEQTGSGYFMVMTGGTQCFHYNRIESVHEHVQKFADRKAQKTGALVMCHVSVQGWGGEAELIWAEPQAKEQAA